jgi:hypothetical protein
LFADELLLAKSSEFWVVITNDSRLWRFLEIWSTAALAWLLAALATAQDFFGAFCHDGLGQIGSGTTINSSDIAILMIAVQLLEKRTAELKHTKAQLAAMAERLQALELRNNHCGQIASEKSLGDNLRQNKNLTH